MHPDTHALIVIDVQNDFCPGGALPALGTGRTEVFLFVAALLAGIFTAKALQKTIANRAIARA